VLLCEIFFDIEMPLKDLAVLILICFVTLWLMLSITTVIADIVNPDIGTLSTKLNKQLTFDYFVNKSRQFEYDRKWKGVLIDYCINQYVQWEGLIKNVDRISDYTYAVIIRNIKYPQALAKANIPMEHRQKFLSKLEVDRKIRLRAHLRLDYEIPYLHNAKIMKIT
jgi:hypothetical protein